MNLSKLKLSKLFRRFFANSFGTAWNPEQWAAASVAELYQNMVFGMLVNRDFEEMFQEYGDTVNTRQVGQLEASNKTLGADVTTSDLTTRKIPIVLDQHCHVSFIVNDVDQSKSFQDLITAHIAPAARGQARLTDRTLAGRVYDFLERQAGTLGGLTSSNAVALITDAGRELDISLTPEDDRNIVWNSYAHALIIQNSVFHEADKRGDTEGLRNASIGRKFGFDHWHDQLVPQVNQSNHTYTTAAINNAAGYVVGDTVLTVDAAGAGAAAGRWCKIAGKMYHITAANITSNAGTITLEYGLLDAIADNAVVTFGAAAAVDLAAGYAANYYDGILVDNASGAVGPTPQLGQLVTFGTTNTRYTIVKVVTGATEHTIYLNKPLAAAIADNAVVNYGMAGGFNFGFHRNALTLAIRPLKPPMSGTGAVSSTINWGNVTNRVTFTYDGVKQNQRCTLDYLAGNTILDSALGVVVLS